MQCSFNQTPATFSQVQSPQSPTIAQSFSTQTQTYMKPCSTQTILASTHQYRSMGNCPCCRYPWMQAPDKQVSYNIHLYSIGNNVKHI